MTEADIIGLRKVGRTSVSERLLDLKVERTPCAAEGGSPDPISGSLGPAEPVTVSFTSGSATRRFSLEGPANDVVDEDCMVIKDCRLIGDKTLWVALSRPAAAHSPTKPQSSLSPPRLSQMRQSENSKTSRTRFSEPRSTLIMVARRMSVRPGTMSGNGRLEVHFWRDTRDTI
jgi:hypothetical protein